MSGWLAGSAAWKAEQLREGRGEGNLHLQFSLPMEEQHVEGCVRFLQCVYVVHNPKQS